VIAAGRFREVLRYLATGTLSVVLNILVVAFFTEWVGLNYLVSISLCFVTVTFASFFLNRSWTFEDGKLALTQELVRYVAVTLTQLPLSLLACGFCVQVLHLPYALAMALVSAVFVPTTYLIHRRWSFGLSWSESARAGRTQAAALGARTASANNCPPPPSESKSSTLSN
jgi:putative flippase GtrA